MTPTLNTKQGSEWTNDLGQTFPARTLYRFTDDNGEGGCWFDSLERAATSWERWVAGAPARARRRSEARELRERVEAAQRAHGESTDPFARLDA